MEHDFSRVKNSNYRGSLVKEMPDVTDHHMEAAFGHGAGMKSQNKEKYSKDVVVHDKKQGHMYTVYKSYGVWRIGGDKSHDHTKRLPSGQHAHSANPDALHAHILKAGSKKVGMHEGEDLTRAYAAAKEVLQKS